MPLMNDAQLQAYMRVYQIDLEEARRRNRVMVNHRDHPHDPICVGCARRPHEIPGYVDAVEADIAGIPTEDDIKHYVMDEEGTYNSANGHFLCDMCYIYNGSPSSPTGWKCP